MYGAAEEHERSICDERSVATRVNGVLTGTCFERFILLKTEQYLGDMRVINGYDDTQSDFGLRVVWKDSRGCAEF